MLAVLVVSVGLTLAARDFFKLDVHAPDEVQERPASRFDSSFIAHRRELKIVAQIGLAISLVRLAADCFGLGWPGPSTRVLFFAGMTLLAIGIEVGKPHTSILKCADKAAKTVFLILLLLYVGSLSFHRPALSRILEQVLIVLLFAWETLFFTYGEMRAVETQGNALKT
ncbi:MAG: hypothetical protein ABSG13_07570 [Bryobacteraceae bacterium]